MCESSAAHQQGWRVDVDGLDDCKLLLDLLDGGPRPVQLHFHPVPDAAVFPLEGGDQRLLWELEAEREFVSTRRKDRDLTVICSRDRQKHLTHCGVRFVSISGPQSSKSDINSCQKSTALLHQQV